MSQACLFCIRLSVWNLYSVFSHSTEDQVGRPGCHRLLHREEKAISNGPMGQPCGVSRQNVSSLNGLRSMLGNCFQFPGRYAKWGTLHPPGTLYATVHWFSHPIRDGPLLWSPPHPRIFPPHVQAAAER